MVGSFMVGTLWSRYETNGTVRSTIYETVVGSEVTEDEVLSRKPIVYEFNHHHHRALKL